MALGFIAAFSETLALSVIVVKGVVPLVQSLVTETEDHIRAAAAWSLGQLGRHTSEHARAVADANVLPKLLAVYSEAVAAVPPSATSEDLAQKAKRALKFIIAKLVYVPALDPLLHTSPPEILRYVIEQYAKILPGDQDARRMFVSSGGLQKVQGVDAEPGTTLREAVEAINTCFPPEVVKYYSPDYAQTLLELV
eukprot:gnl/Ergobibamus_cyprinoides/1174.p2 GENE.gnl/Ergobibamus_cyprinoides/1174~~gnl/Ergobibamus_cyprinoides/1174.p2  ORF type:complete len:195 (+),score=63.34 gnl/Ergobibamus_cyprinoides/1174:150-734(+)